MEDKNNGRPSLYRPEYDEQIILKAEAKKNMYRIADDFGVCFDTLQEWCHVHPTFSVAYKRARNVQTSNLFERIDNGLDDRNFNVKGAALLLAHVARLSEQRNVQVTGIGKGSLKSRVEAVLATVEQGSLNADEVSKLVNAIAQAAKVEEVTELREQLEKYEDEQAVKC